MDPDLKSNFAGCIKEMKGLATKPTFNPSRKVWILEVSPAVFRYMVVRGHVVVDYVQVSVTEYLDVATYYKCCRLGHV